MENFKEIAEKCLSGELKGTFKNRKGESIPSETLCRSSSKTYPYFYCVSHGVTIHGDYYKSGKFPEYDIIDFIPDNMQEQIKIDIPEGKVPVMEQTESGVVITWKEKELTYEEIFEHLRKNKEVIYYVTNGPDDVLNTSFIKKTNILRKLINIRNYFGKPDKNNRGWIIEQGGIRRTICESKYNVNVIVFAKCEHAEQAIKMLGDELKYLFEPW